jgi:capsular polysaccharide biosynthesis protein
MELRQYWKIIWKRAWIPLALLLIVLGASLVLRQPSPPLYQATLRVLVGVKPEPARGEYYTYDRYYTWLSSEYLADDFSEVVKYSAFARDVTAKLAAGPTPVEVPPGAIQGATVAEKQHRILTLHVTWGDPQQLTAIATAAAQVLAEEGGKYFAQVGLEGVSLTVIDEPTVTQVPPGLSQRLDLPLRLVLALVAGLALAFFLDYLDDSVRDRAELEALGIAVLGELPLEK